MASKDVLKAIVREQFSIIGRAVKEATTSRENYRLVMADLEKRSGTYTEAYLAEQGKKIRAEYVARQKAIYNRVMAALGVLETTLGELHNALDLTDPALSTALKAIEIGGQGMSMDDVKRVNAPFANDQAALRLLAAAYHAQGVNAGGVKDQLYVLEDAIKDMETQVYMGMLTEGGSLNIMAGVLSRYAKLEGNGDLINALPDRDGVDAAILSRVGLR